MKTSAICLVGLLAAVFWTSPDIAAGDRVCPKTGGVCCCYKEVKSKGWKALESNRFRIHYSGSIEAVIPLVSFCEETCEALRNRWIADRRETWSCKCDIFLYPTPRLFERGAHAPAEMWGVADLEIGHGKVWKRRLHMRADDPTKLTPVLTHEMTHVVLAEHFCRKPIPRWADEGIAVYSEPRERQQRMLSFLKDEASQKRLLPLKQVTTMRDGPQNERESEIFYGQSGAVIEYLVAHHKLSETQILTFVGLCGEVGWERAITKTLPDVTAAKFETEWRQWLTTRDEGLLTSAEGAAESAVGPG
jgi:hypothetical protein